jgi:hypothetical protein
MGANNADFFEEWNKHHVPFNDWDGNGSSTAYADVRKGVSHPDVIHAFSNGHCHGLACQINELAGHPIGKVTFKNAEDVEPWDVATQHFFNYDKNDPKFGFDIHGRRLVTDIVKHVQGPHGSPLKHVKISKEQFHEETANENDWLPIHHDASATAAKQILGMTGND